MRRTQVARLRHSAVGLAVLFTVGLLTVVAAVQLSAQTGTIERVSVTNSGIEANADSFFPAVSSDGRIVAFKTRATNLSNQLPEDLQFDVYVHDRDNGQTTLVSLTEFGQVGNDNSFPPALDDDGSQVAFASSATNMVMGDVNGAADVWVRNRGAGTTEPVSLTQIGTLPSAGGSRDLPPSMTGDGRLVAFETTAILTENDPNTDLADVYVRDRVLGVTELISVRTVTRDPFPAYAPAISRNGCVVAFVSDSQRLIAQGQDTNERLDVYLRDRCASPPFTALITRGFDGSQTTRDSQQSLFPPALDDEGDLIVYESLAINLVPGDTNNVSDVFLYDRLSGVTERLSVNSYGDQADGASVSPSISGDGRFVVFSSVATNFVEGTGGRANIFVRDRFTNETCQVSIGTQGPPATGNSINPVISRDGRWIAFESTSPLVPGGTPGRRHIYLVENVQENQVCPEPATPTPTLPAPTATPGPDDCCQCPDEFCELPGDGRCPESCDVVYRAACVSEGCVTFTPTPAVTPTQTPGDDDCCQCPEDSCDMPESGHCHEECFVIYQAACLEGGCATFTPTPDGTPTPTLGPDDCCDCPEEPDLCADPVGNECPQGCTGVYDAACLGSPLGCVPNTAIPTPTPTRVPGDDDCCDCPDDPNLCAEPSAGACPEGCGIAYDAACLGAPAGCVANTPTPTMDLRSPSPTNTGSPPVTPTQTVVAPTSTATIARTATPTPTSAGGGGGGGCGCETNPQPRSMGLLALRDLLALLGPALLLRFVRRRDTAGA